MPALRSGTVTLLFTDVEGSTRLQRSLGASYAEVISEHHRLLRETFEAHGGRVIDSQADSFFCAFPRVKDAVAAAAHAQRAFAAHDWYDGAEVRVRMGIHAGEPEVAGDRYLGLPVVRAARICDTAHGGQVLLSRLARDLLADHEPRDVALRDLGAYRLKDFDAPEPLAQLVIDGLPSRFPPPRTQPPRRRRRTVPLVAAAIALAGVLAVGVALAMRGSSGISGIGPMSVGVIDAKTNELVAEIPLGFTTPLIAGGGGFVWVVDPAGSTLVKIDPRARRIVNTRAIGAESIPFGLAVAGGTVWVTALRGQSQILLEFSAEHGGLQRSRTVARRSGYLATPFLPSNALTTGGGAVWLLQPGPGAVSKIDLTTRDISEIRDGVAGVSLAAGQGQIWIADRGEVSKVDSATGDSVAINVGSPYASDESIALGESVVWYTQSSSRHAWRIDPRSDRLIPPPVRLGRNPNAIAVGAGAVWVANADGTVTRLDPSGGKRTTIPLGSPAAGIVVAHGAVWTSPGDAVS